MDTLTAADRHLFCLQPLHPGPCEGWKAAKAAGLDHTIAHPDLAPKRRKRAKSKAAPVVAPAVTEADRKQDHALAVLANANAQRKKINVLADLEQRAILDEEDNPAVLARSVRAKMKTGGLEDDEDMQALAESAELDDREGIAHALRRVANRLGLERIGGIPGRSLQIVRYNPKEHEGINGKHLPVGTRVELVKPGYYGQSLDGDRVVLSKAKVIETDEPAPTSPWEKTFESGIKSRRQLSDSDNTSKVELVTFGDGSKKVYKTSKHGEAMDKSHDAEELGAMVARQLGLKPPGVFRTGPDDAYFDYIDSPGARIGMDVAGWGRPVPRAHVDSVDGRRMGLYDAITENIDRNPGNWFEELPESDQENAEVEIIPIDHGMSWEGGDDPLEAEPTTNPFAGHYINTEEGGWRANDLSPRYVASVRELLQDLRPQFEQRGRGTWHDRMMQRLAVVASNARGETVL